MAISKTTSRAPRSIPVYFASRKRLKNSKAFSAPWGAGPPAPAVCPNRGRAKNAAPNKAAIAAR